MSKGELAITLGATGNMTFALACVLFDIKKFVKQDFDLFIYYKDISQKEIELLNSIIPAKFIEYNKEFDVRKKSLNRYSSIAFSRYECFDMLKDYKKVLWLDIDVIIQKDLSDLFNTDADMAMWQNDIHKNSFNFTKPVQGYDMQSNYYNTGVMFLSDSIKNYKSLKYWCYDKTDEFGELLVCSDQGIINILTQEFDINVQNLSESFNCHPAKQNLLENAVILHPYAEEKFWNYYNFEQWNNNYKTWIKMGGAPYAGKKANFIDKALVKFKKKYLPQAPDPLRHTGKFVKYVYEHNFKKV